MHIIPQMVPVRITTARGTLLVRPQAPGDDRATCLPLLDAVLLVRSALIGPYRAFNGEALWQLAQLFLSSLPSSRRLLNEDDPETIFDLVLRQLGPGRRY